MTNRKLQEGDRVKFSDIREDSIAAYKALRGKIIEVNDYGNVRVHWECDRAPDVNWTPGRHLALADD